MRRGFLPKSSNKHDIVNQIISGLIDDVVDTIQYVVKPEMIESIYDIQSDTSDIAMNWINISYSGIWKESVIKYIKVYPISVIGKVDKILNGFCFIEVSIIFKDDYKPFRIEHVYCERSIDLFETLIINHKYKFDIIPSKMKKFQYEVVNIHKFSSKQLIPFSTKQQTILHTLEEADYTDCITGYFLDDPVRFKSNGVLLDTPVNRSTAEECEKCPFTNTPKIYITIIDANDITEKLEVWKKLNKDIYIKFMELQEKNIIDDDMKIETKIRTKLNNATSFLSDPDIQNIQYNLVNNHNNDGIGIKELKKIKDLLHTEHFNIGNDKYLYYIIEYIYNTTIPIKLILYRQIESPDIIIIITIPPLVGIIAR